MDPVEEIKSRLSVEDVVGRVVDLKPSGASYKGLCPFHSEKTPSFYVTPARGTFHCFGCGKGGDIFTFLMELERLSFADALRRLGEQAGVSIPERERQQPSHKKRLLEVNEAAASYFSETLESNQGERARHYLAERHFSENAIHQFDFGYAPDGREGLCRRLRAGGFDDRILLAAGLALAGDQGEGVRDRFRGRLMLPIRDAGRGIVGFGGRSLGDVQPKYLNSPQTEIFDKSAVLYGIQYAAEPIRQAKSAVLVEGYLDAVRAHLGGFSNVVASLGTAVTAKQLQSLSRFADSVVIALDPDAAGQSAAARTTLVALADVTQTKGRSTGSSAALDVRIAVLPAEHGDPDELIRLHPEIWDQTIALAVPAFDFFFDQTIKSLDRSRESWKQEAIDRVLPIIQLFAGASGAQGAWVQRLARATELDARLLLQSLPRAARPKQRRASPAEPINQQAVSSKTSQGITVDARLEVEQALISLLLKMVVVSEETAVLIEAVSWGKPEHEEIAAQLLAWRSTGNFDYQMLRERLSEVAQAAGDSLYGNGYPLPAEDLWELAVQFHLARMDEFKLRTDFDRAIQTLQDLEPEDRQTATLSLADLLEDRKKTERALERLSRLVVQSPANQNHGTIDQASGSS